MEPQIHDRRAVMGWRRRGWLIPALVVGWTMTGCGDPVPTDVPTTSDFVKERELLAKQNAASGGKARRSPGSGPVRAADGQAGSGDPSYAAADGGYSYDARGKRDPFRSFRFANSENERDREAFGPLVDFELGQLELSAVIWDATNPRALILDPGGRSYIVREGSPIGKNRGQIIHIGDNLVLVKETYENFAGEKTTKDVELRIRLSQGG
jgi:type IV pilus assembly protein PilP